MPVPYIGANWLARECWRRSAPAWLKFCFTAHDTFIGPLSLFFATTAEWRLERAQVGPKCLGMSGGAGKISLEGTRRSCRKVGGKIESQPLTLRRRHRPPPPKVVENNRCFFYCDYDFELKTEKGHSTLAVPGPFCGALFPSKCALVNGNPRRLCCSDGGFVQKSQTSQRCTSPKTGEN